jgi:hypothetical protein
LDIISFACVAAAFVTIFKCRTWIVLVTNSRRTDRGARLGVVSSSPYSTLKFVRMNQMIHRTLALSLLGLKL